MTGAAPKRREDDFLVNKAMALAAESLPVLRLVLPDLPSFSPINRAAAALARAEAIVLERDYFARQGAIFRYMDSRDVAGDDAGSERVLL